MDSYSDMLISGYGQSSQAVSRTSQAKYSTGSSTDSSQAGTGKDTVTISDTAKEFHNIMAKARGEKTDDDSGSSDPIERIRKQIEEIEKKIAQVEQSSAPEETKKGAVDGLQAQLTALQQQLNQLLADSAKSGSGTATGSGTSSKKG